MSVTSLHDWRLPGCGDACRPRQHDPADHEAYGRLLERHATTHLEIGALSIDLPSSTVRVGGVVIRLSPNEWALLRHLAVNAGRWCSLEAITRDLWGDVAEKLPGHHARVTMGRLRFRLGACRDLILTRPGFGYLLRASLTAPLPLSSIPMRRIGERWARDYDACTWCHTTDRPHSAHGLCTRCRSKQKRAGVFL